MYIWVHVHTNFVGVVFGPQPRPSAGPPGAISYSKISSGDFILDEILHQAHLLQQIYVNCFKPSSKEFSMTK